MQRDHLSATRRTGPQRSLSRPNSDGKREQIAAAALRVLLAEGVFGSTTRKIAEEAGVSVATLHYHFRDKDEILLPVMESFVQTCRAALAEQFPTAQTLHQRIESLIDFICGEIKKGPDEQLLLQEMTIYMLRDPDLAALARAKDLHFQSLNADALSGVIAQGPERSQQIARLSNLICTNLVGIFNQWLAAGDTELFDRTAQDLVLSARAFADEHLGAG